MSLTLHQALPVALAALLAAAGLALLIAVRRPGAGRRVWLPGIGTLSDVTHVVCGLALVYPAPSTDIVGIVGVLAVYFWQKLRRVAPA